MAIDESLLIQCNMKPAPVLRFYKWQPAALSLGYFQKISEIDVEACKGNNISIVRRPTGGRAVLHKDELTYSIILPLHCLPGTILESYVILSKALCSGLRELGISASLIPNKKEIAGGTAACFDAPSFYELTVEGKKIIGSAQTRRGNSLLQHGSVPIFNNNELLINLLELSSSKKTALARILKQKAGALLDFMNNDNNYTVANYLSLAGLIEEALLKGFQKEMDITFIEDDLSQEEKIMADNLYKEKYSNELWNYERGKENDSI